VTSVVVILFVFAMEKLYFVLYLVLFGFLLRYARSCQVFPLVLVFLCV
jgi:hypothetical protein